MAPKKVYAVRKGRAIGIFNTWAECEKQIRGFSGAEYKSFLTKEEAQVYMDGAKSFEPININLEEGNPSKELVIAYVDGSYNLKTKEYGSGGVIFWSGEKIEFSFKGSIKELATMRNVAGEIEAAKYAMEFTVSKGAKEVIIHYDYEGVEKWCTGAWKANKEGTKAYVESYKTFVQDIKIRFIKVEAHTGDKYNEEADVLAKASIGLM